MSNTNLLADLDSFYRGSANGPTQNQQSQAPHSTPSQSKSDPFGFGSVAQGSQGPPTATGSNALDDDDDDWGGFETAEPAESAALSVPKPFNVAPVTSPVPALTDPIVGVMSSDSTPTPPVTNQTSPPRPPGHVRDQEPAIRNRPARAPTMELIANSLLDLGIPSQEPSEAPPSTQNVLPRSPQQKPVQKPKDPNVLFDADDIEDEDDEEFGAFETVDSHNSPATDTGRPTKVPASVDLLSMDDPLPAPESNISNASKRPSSLLTDANITSAPPYPSAIPTSPLKQRSPYPDLAVSTSRKEEVKQTTDSPTPSPATPWPEFNDGGSAKVPTKEDWGPFSDFPPGKPRKTVPAPRVDKLEEPDNWDWDAIDTPDTTSQPLPPLSSRDDYDDKEPPPTNIPPPSILMTILPELFSLANSSLFKPTAGQSAAARKKLFSDPSTIAFLRAYLLIATVAARILAGRKLRWNRDKFLAQGMAISAAGAKGMKLAGVDKAEASREDREATDVVAAWKEQVGKVRAAVAGANGAISEQGGLPLRVPEIGESMRVNTVKVSPKAPRPCVVCGLKREERVAKVDFEVEDSFGEWWVEHWGHRACRNFWKEHEGRLRQR
ncbi:hypothetical protein VUR80DRAFT_6314 [Thermomyces stellatus]